MATENVGDLFKACATQENMFSDGSWFTAGMPKQAVA
jgi:hypothetical protein